MITTHMRLPEIPNMPFRPTAATTTKAAVYEQNGLNKLIPTSRHPRKTFFVLSI